MRDGSQETGVRSQESEDRRWETGYGRRGDGCAFLFVLVEVCTGDMQPLRISS